MDKRTGMYYWVVYTDALMVDVPQVSYQTAATPFTYEDLFFWGGDMVTLKYHTSRHVMLFRLLKQQQLGRRFHSKEEVELAVCK
jgi:hypothetical protein